MSKTKSSETASAEETKQYENDENIGIQLNQGEQQVTVHEVMLPETNNVEEEITDLYEMQKISVGKLSQLSDQACCLLMEVCGDTAWREMVLIMDEHNIAWKKFVGVHETLIQALGNDSEKELACEEYRRQQNKKLELDARVSKWHEARKAPSELEGIGSKKSHKSSRSGSSRASSSSSKLSRQSKRKEKMALAHLKLQQLKVLQEYEKEEQELSRRRELFVAEMEAQQATMSYQIIMEQEAKSCDMNAPIEAVVAKQQLNEESPICEKVHEDKVPNLTPVSKVPSVEVVPNFEQHAEPTTFKLSEQKVEKSYGEEIAKALQQVVNTPKIEYMKFNGDPLRYVTFIHNFESCLGRDSHDKERRLQLLIQHCTGKARESIESCVNLPNGYEVARRTLQENFGKAHIIAAAHIKKLLSLADLKTADGQSLLEFARQLTITERTLAGMGSAYVSELNHMTTLRELVKKLPMFLRAKWTETAGKILEKGKRPDFQDLVKFVNNRATLVNNEFGSDMVRGKLTKSSEKKVTRENTSFSGHVRNEQSQRSTARCSVCSEQHGVWRCNLFKCLDYEAKRKCVQENGLCNKCLDKGHISKNCPKTRFRCLIENCGGEHHTLMHRPNKPIVGGKPKDHVKQEELPENLNRTAIMSEKQTGVSDKGSGLGKSDGSLVVGATGGGESKVCLGVIPVKVYRSGSDAFVETYALMDNGSEVTLCDEQLSKQLGLVGRKAEFMLTGMTGSSRVQSKEVSLTVKSMDEATVVELPNVKTVRGMPISSSCIPRSEDLSKWPHLQGIDIPELENGTVMLLIGVKERPGLFLPLEYKMGEETEPVAIKYSLGWTVIGPVGGRKLDQSLGVNLIHMSQPTSALTCNNELAAEISCVCLDDDYDMGELSNDASLSRGLERLWKTDFADTCVDVNVNPSIEDRRALEIMENSLTMVEGHYQVALPWRKGCPSLLDNKEVAEKRLSMLKKRLTKDPKLLEKYTTAIEEYIEQGHAQKIPEEELKQKDSPVWYLPHHPVTHPMKPEKVRVVFDCAAKHNGTSLNEQLLQGPDLANSLVGVLIRFREEPIALVADIEGMFSQIRVDPKDCDALRFLWWENANLEANPAEYRMVKHVFGATSSPSCANLCVKKLASSSANKEKFDPETIKTVERNMYVDDLIKSVSDTQTANRLVAQLIELMKSGGFRLTKWVSNSRETLLEIPQSEKAKSVVNLKMDELPTESTLGLKWNVKNDEFVWEVQEKMFSLAGEKLPTRRAILSIVSSLFDPLGF